MFEFLAALFVVTLVSSLAKAAVGTGAQTIQMNQQANLNSNLMDKQAGLNREQYDYEYSKESPASRVSQYIAANLNPGLMYSNGVAGMQGSVGSVNGSSVGLPNFSNLFNLEESVNALDKLGLTEPSKVKMDNLKSVIELNNANKAIAEAMPDKIKAETDAIRFETHLKKALESTTIDTAKKNLDIATESYKSLQEQVKQLKEQNKVLPDKLQNDLKAQNTALALADWDLYYKQTYGDAEAKKRLTQLDALAQELFSRVDVNKNMATQLKELANKYKTDSEYQSYVNDVLKNRGFDVSNGGVYGLIERAAVFFGRLVDGDVYK